MESARTGPGHAEADVAHHAHCLQHARCRHDAHANSGRHPPTTTVDPISDQYLLRRGCQPLPPTANIGPRRHPPTIWSSHRQNNVTLCGAGGSRKMYRHDYPGVGATPAHRSPVCDCRQRALSKCTPATLPTPGFGAASDLYRLCTRCRSAAIAQQCRCIRDAQPCRVTKHRYLGSDGQWVANLSGQCPCAPGIGRTVQQRLAICPAECGRCSPENFSLVECPSAVGDHGPG